VDVEPLVAYWDTDTDTLDSGIAHSVGEIAKIPSIQVIIFATNSLRMPSVMPEVVDVRIAYRARMMKPLRTGPFDGLPAPGVVVGDQIATDGVLAYRLGYSFVRYNPGRDLPIGPSVMAGVGWLVRPFVLMGPESTPRV
jgi:hypothetical protein